MNDPIELISLAELIEQVKSDLLEQVAVGGARNPLFYIDSVEVTAQVVARREKGEGGKAGLSLSVLGLKTDAGIDTRTTVGHELTQVVAIKLSPLLGKAEYLARLAPEQRERAERLGTRAVVRGGGQGGTGETV